MEKKIISTNIVVLTKMNIPSSFNTHNLIFFLSFFCFLSTKTRQKWEISFGAVSKCNTPHHHTAFFVSFNKNTYQIDLIFTQQSTILLYNATTTMTATMMDFIDSLHSISSFFAYKFIFCTRFDGKKTKSNIR